VEFSDRKETPIGIEYTNATVSYDGLSISGLTVQYDKNLLTFKLFLAERCIMKLSSIIMIMCLSQFAGPAVDGVLQQSKGTASVTGQIYDSLFGLPLSNARIALLNKAGDVRETASDEDGKFDIKDLVAGQYVVAVELRGFVRTQRTIQVNKNERIVLDISLRIGRLHDPLPTEVVGTVTDSNSAPVISAMLVVVSPVEQRIVATSKTDQAGEYRIQVDDPGQYVVYAFKSGLTVRSTAILLRPRLPRERYKADFVLSALKLE
jgi:hypothetical protein